MKQASFITVLADRAAEHSLDKNVICELMTHDLMTAIQSSFPWTNTPAYSKNWSAGWVGFMVFVTEIHNRNSFLNYRNLSFI